MQITNKQIDPVAARTAWLLFTDALIAKATRETEAEKIAQLQKLIAETEHLDDLRGK